MFWTFKLSFDVDTLAFLGLALFQNIGQFFSKSSAHPVQNFKH
jgi:hypothetical protein